MSRLTYGKIIRKFRYALIDVNSFLSFCLNLTVVGFARQNRFSIFSASDRVLT